MKLVPPSLPRSSYVPSSIGLYCSACFGSLFVSILCTCCSHFFWYCFISFTMFYAPVFCLIHLFFSLSSLPVTVNTEIPVTTFVLPIKDTDVSILTFPSMLNISCCQDATAPKRAPSSQYFPPCLEIIYPQNLTRDQNSYGRSFRKERLLAKYQITQHHKSKHKIFISLTHLELTKFNQCL